MNRLAKFILRVLCCRDWHVKHQCTTSMISHLEGPCGVDLGWQVFSAMVVVEKCTISGKQRASIITPFGRGNLSLEEVERWMINRDVRLSFPTINFTYQPGALNKFLNENGYRPSPRSDFRVGPPPTGGSGGTSSEKPAPSGFTAGDLASVKKHLEQMYPGEKFDLQVTSPTREFTVADDGRLVPKDLAA